MKLVKSSKNVWVWLYGPGEQTQKFCGGLLSAMYFGKTELKILEKELVYAVSDMVKKNDDVAEFGDIMGSFLFSRKGRVE
jgi:hypothetical protein